MSGGRILRRAELARARGLPSSLEMDVGDLCDFYHDQCANPWGVLGGTG